MATVALKNGVVVLDDEGRYHTLYAGQPVPDNADKKRVKELTADGFLGDGAEAPDDAEPAKKTATKKTAKRAAKKTPATPPASPTAPATSGGFTPAGSSTSGGQVWNIPEKS